MDDRATGNPATGNRGVSRADPSTEDAVLRAQAEAAHEAIAATLARLKGNLKEAADVRIWTQRHPWIALGAAATAGVAAAGIVKKPRKDDSRVADDDEPHSAAGTTRANQAKQGRPMFDKLFGGMFDLAAISLQHWLMGMVQAHVVSQAAGDAARQGTDETTQEASGNGPPPETEPVHAFH
jgi:hypothetical protein